VNFTNRKLKFFAERANFGANVDIRFGYQDESGGHHIAKPCEMEFVPEGAYHITPSMSLRRDEAQALMDELWQCGLRPTEGSGSAGSLAATERHLADLQRIVFKGYDKLNKGEAK